MPAEKCKSCEIYRRKCDVHEEVCLRQKNVYNWAKLFKEDQNRIQNEVRPDLPTTANPLDFEDSINELFLADKYFWGQGTGH